MTLRSAIAGVLFADAKRDKHMSTQQIALHRLKYATGDIPEAVLQMKPSDSKAKVQKPWETACALASHPQLNRRQRGPLMGLLPTVQSLNSVEVKLLLRCCMTLRPAAHEDIRSFLLQTMRCVVRLDVEKDEERMVRCLKKVWDETMTACYSEAQKAEMSLHEFWDIHKDLARLAMGRDSTNLVSMLLNIRGGTHREHLHHLDIVCNSSSIGRAMLSWAKPKAVQQEIIELCKSTFQPPEQGKVTAKTLHEWTNTLYDAVERMNAESVLGQRRRTVKMPYRGMDISLEVCSVGEEVRYRMACWLKSYATGGDLGPLQWEEFLLSAKAQLKL